MSTTALAAIRASNAVIGRLAPATTGRRIGRVFTTPRPRPLKPWEEAVEAGATRFALSTGLSGLHWPGSGPRVLALHGWEGRATQFGPLADRLRIIDADVTALDGPAHGRSLGTRANPIAFARALLDADRELGPFDVVAGHSMGAASAALALAWGLRAQKAVLLAGPASLPGVLLRFARFVHLPPRATERFVAELEAHAGMPPHLFEIERFAPTLERTFLVIHDADDHEVPVTEAHKLAAVLPDVRYIETTGLGHNRVLRDASVLDHVGRFITG